MRPDPWDIRTGASHQGYRAVAHATRLAAPRSGSPGCPHGVPVLRNGLGDELADPVASLCLDMPRHCLRRGRRRIGNVFAYFPAIKPAATVRIAGFGDQADRLALLQQRVAVGGEESTRKLDRDRQLAHQQKRAGGLRLGLRDQHPEQAMDGRNGVRRRRPGRIQNSAGCGDREILAVGPPAARDQPLTAAAADKGWLCVIRPGNIRGHGDDKGFREHMLLQGETVEAKL